jgi:phospholipid/cholesterol/gamma-HCH transport system substrate-binding protein
MRLKKRSFADLFLLVVFAVICIGGLGYLAKGMGMPLPFVQQGWTLKASFAHAEGLVPQSDVYESGVAVGKVLGVQTNGDKGAIVTMRINRGVSIRRDIKAYVEPKTAIGDTYVNLVRTQGSTAPTVTSGYDIPLAHTGQSVQLDQILNTMNPATRAAMSQSLQELGIGVAGRSGDINKSLPQVNQVLANLQPIVQVANARQHDINQILVNLAVIMHSLAQEQQSLGHLVTSGDSALGAIAGRDQQLGGTVRGADKLMGSLQQVLNGLTPADRASLAESPPTLQTGLKLIAQLNPTIDRLLPELLLAQVNYPNNQNSVVSTGSETVAREWISAFSQRDSMGYAMRVTPVIDLGNNVKLPLSLPSGQQGSQSGSGGSQASSKDAAGGSIPSVAQLLLGMP